MSICKRANRILCVRLFFLKKKRSKASERESVARTNYVVTVCV